MCFYIVLICCDDYCYDDNCTYLDPSSILKPRTTLYERLRQQMTENTEDNAAKMFALTL